MNTLYKLEFRSKFFCSGTTWLFSTFFSGTTVGTCPPLIAAKGLFAGCLFDEAAGASGCNPLKG